MCLYTHIYMFIHLHTLIQCTGNSAKNKANKNPCFHEVYILVEERSRQLTHKLSTYICNHFSL